MKVKGVGQQVKYVETFPLQQELIFSDSHTYTQFYDKRFREVVGDGNDWSEKFKAWKYVSYKINKDGKPRKPIDPTWLQSPKSRKKQSIAWKNYLNAKADKAKQRQVFREKDYACLVPSYICKYCGHSTKLKIEMQGHLAICGKRMEEIEHG